jgi:hypothetical protein
MLCEIFAKTWRVALTAGSLFDRSMACEILAKIWRVVLTPGSSFVRVMACEIFAKIWRVESQVEMAKSRARARA